MAGTTSTNLFCPAGFACCCPPCKVVRTPMNPSATDRIKYSETHQPSATRPIVTRYEIARVVFTSSTVTSTTIVETTCIRCAVAFNAVDISQRLFFGDGSSDRCYAVQFRPQDIPMRRVVIHRGLRRTAATATTPCRDFKLVFK